MSGVPLETVEIEPRAAADAAVLLMHGLGADGHDFEPLVAELRLPASPSVRWVFPHGPVRPVTLNGGYRMRAWYDIAAIDRRAPEDEAGIRESAEAVGRLVRRERERGIAADRIVLAGFSQGGALALFTALRWPERLGGVVGLSCYLPLAATLGAEAHPANAALPVFLAHGTMDPIVPAGLGEGSRDLLLAQGYDVEWHAYPMPHSVCGPEVADLRAWLLRALPRG
ncbi:MAG TPA: alpha/beta hydrolase fold domain-containing protein [Vicinamibacteria bacterium]|nr:alpha/beta hydrolase fold domain-containing protein [Vicinamibacteria bacterium]